MPSSVAPPGLKGLAVADTTIGAVRGSEGFYHYRQYNAIDVAASRSFEAVAHLLLEGELPSPAEEAAFRSELAAARQLPESMADLTDRFAEAGHDPMSSLRGLLSVAVDPTPLIDQGVPQRKDSVITAIGLTPSILARIYRRQHGVEPLGSDPTLSHSADYVRMVTGSTPSEANARAVETYLSLTADHGFNASTFTARVIASTGADIGGALSGAVASLMGPLHGGAPSRVLDMLDAIGDPAGTEEWALAELEAGNVLMGFGHAVYRADDPRSILLRRTAVDMGGELVDRAIEIEQRVLAVLREWKPDAVIVTNVEYYAAVVLHLSGIPQEMFTPAFTTSRIVGWSAHILEQAVNNRIMRPSANYTGVEPPRPLPDTGVDPG